jgi:hypothetical protein
MEKFTETPSGLDRLPYDRFPILFRFYTAITAKGIRMELRDCEKGTELRFTNEVNGLPNRANLRIFFPNEAKCVLFFHKKSTIPYSRDRFSYGGIVIDARTAATLPDTEIEEWIEFLVSGLSPKFRPKTLKKSIPYTIPPD